VGSGIQIYDSQYREFNNLKPEIRINNIAKIYFQKKKKNCKTISKTNRLILCGATNPVHSEIRTGFKMHCEKNAEV
jgi:hypothetical protein